MNNKELFNGLYAISKEMMRIKNIPLVTQEDAKVIKHKDYYLSTGILIRIGKTDEIMTQFNDGFIEFGCPANWITYAKNDCSGIADKYEAIIGHVHNDDPRLSVLGDDGIPLNMFRSLWMDDCGDGKVFVRYLIHCLIPTLCLFSIPVNRLAKNRINSNDVLSVDFRLFKEAYGIKEEREYSVIIFPNPKLFFEDIRRRLVESVSKCNIIDKTYFTNEISILASMVNYDLDIEKDFFEISAYDELFRKRPIYSNQSEARIIIPDVHFICDPVYNAMSYLSNKMKVYVNDIKKYGFVFRSDKVNRIDFYGFNEACSSYEIGIV